MATYLTSKQVEARFQRSAMTLHRWIKDEKLNFPRPMYIRGRRFWSAEALEAWERSHAAVSVAD
jgi:predicted DNA-binding transcriptional regulator AlpA